MICNHESKVALIALLVCLGLLAGCLEESKEAATTAAPNPIGNGNTNNAPPSIAGSPSDVVLYGQNYSFTPTTSDADNDPLQFSVSNRPNWTSFSTSSGALTGSPTLADVGLYPDIVISVSDGTDTSSLPSFSIEVAQTADGSITISISAPTLNTDGSLLTDLAGYKIYYGESEGNYPNEITINNPSISTYVMENLVRGQYYIVATAFNSDDMESGFSDFIIRIAN